MTYTLEQIEADFQRLTQRDDSDNGRFLMVSRNERDLADFARTALPELCARVRELEEQLREYQIDECRLCGEFSFVEHIEDLESQVKDWRDTASLEQKKWGEACARVMELEAEILDPVELAKIAMMQIKFKELEAENAALFKALQTIKDTIADYYPGESLHMGRYKFAKELFDLVEQALAVTRQNEGGAANE